MSMTLIVRDVLEMCDMFNTELLQKVREKCLEQGDVEWSSRRIL